MNMMPDSFVGYAIERGQVKIKVCPSCEDAKELRAWAAAKGTPTKDVPCPKCFQELTSSRLTGRSEVPA